MPDEPQRKASWRDAPAVREYCVRYAEVIFVRERTEDGGWATARLSSLSDERRAEWIGYFAHRGVLPHHVTYGEEEDP
jgi:hypothetical protein